MTGFKAPIRLLLTITGTALVTTLVLVFGFLAYLDRVYTADKCFVRICPERYAVVAGEPSVSTKLYRLGPDMRYLLVATSRLTKEWEMYYIDVVSYEMGVPDFSVYRPFWNGALVAWAAIDGFDDETAVAAAWEWRGLDLHIRVKGWAGNAGQSSESPSDDSEMAADPNEVGPQREVPEMLRLMYAREIVLKLLENRAEGERSSQVSMNQ